nr:hypothetical protein CFP56_12319 [Quercus suber]
MPFTHPGLVIWTAVEVARSLIGTALCTSQDPWTSGELRLAASTYLATALMIEQARIFCDNPVIFHPVQGPRNAVARYDLAIFVNTGVRMSMSAPNSPSPGIYAVITLPLLNRILATLRSPELGFFGFVVPTRRQTPFISGLLVKAGDSGLLALCSFLHPRRTCIYVACDFDVLVKFRVVNGVHHPMVLVPTSNVPQVPGSAFEVAASAESRPKKCDQKGSTHLQDRQQVDHFGVALSKRRSERQGKSAADPTGHTLSCPAVSCDDPGLAVEIPAEG